MSPIVVVILATTLLFALIFIRTPIFVALGLCGLLGLYVVQGMIGLRQVPISLLSQLQSNALVAAPMYILMGEVLAGSSMGKDLFTAAHRWLSRLRGGLGAAAVASGAVFGAMSGVSIASVAVIGKMAVPEMLERGYKPSFASGSVTASGALAMLIPPSLMFILYASVTGVSVGALFIGGIVPGLILAGLMIAYILLAARIRPSLAPSIHEKITWKMRFESLGRLGPSIILIALVLGSIYTGFATATEASAIGAVGAFLVVGVGYRELTWKKAWAAVVGTIRISGAILIIVGAAFIYTKLLTVVRIPDTMANYFTSLDISPEMVLVGVMLAMLVLGCLVDAASLLLVVTPILYPALTTLGFDPIFIGVLLVVNLEMAVITPPVGLNLYTMKTVVPTLRLGDIFRGIVPYIVIEFVFIAILILYPQIATWLPSRMG